MNRLALSLVTLVALFSCRSRNETGRLRSSVVHVLEKQKGTFAVAFRDLSTGETLLINEHEQFHAASTMKTPVMVEVFKQAASGKFNLTDSVPIKNEFKSIVDGSPYNLNPQDDSEQELYHEVGRKKPLMSLLREMIVSSSNLATNIIIEKVGAENVTRTLRKDVGVQDMAVLRGVEDQKAYDKGLNNTVTAYDLMLLFEKIGKGEMIDSESSERMIGILLGQQFNDIIPARLPRNVKVAHKTGWITGLHHDSALVILPDGRRYVLILLSKDLEDETSAIRAMADVSEMIYRHVAKVDRQ